MATMHGQEGHIVLLNAAITTTTNGTAVDLASVTGGQIEVGKAEMKAVLLGTARTYTGSPTVIVTIEEDSTSAFTGATTLATFTTIATTAATNEAKGFSPTKRYIRAVARFSADTTTGSYALTGIYTKRTV